MASCNCGGKRVPIKKVPAKKIAAKKVKAKDPKKITNVKRSRRLSRKATKRAKANAKGCKC